MVHIFATASPFLVDQSERRTKVCFVIKLYFFRSEKFDTFQLSTQKADHRVHYVPLALDCTACARTWAPLAAASGQCAVDDQLPKSTPPFYSETETRKQASRRHVVSRMRSAIILFGAPVGVAQLFARCGSLWFVTERNLTDNSC